MLRSIQCKITTKNTLQDIRKCDKMHVDTTVNVMIKPNNLRTKRIVRQLIFELDAMQADFDKTIRGNRTAAQRIRVASLSLAKKFKLFRKISLKEMHR